MHVAGGKCESEEKCDDNHRDVVVVAERTLDWPRLPRAAQKNAHRKMSPQQYAFSYYLELLSLILVYRSVVFYTLFYSTFILSFNLKFVLRSTILKKNEGVAVRKFW
jgi:hypothetical protein